MFLWVLTCIFIFVKVLQIFFRWAKKDISVLPASNYRFCMSNLAFVWRTFSTRLTPDRSLTTLTNRMNASLAFTANSTEKICQLEDNDQWTGRLALLLGSLVKFIKNKRRNPAWKYSYVTIPYSLADSLCFTSGGISNPTFKSVFVFCKMINNLTFITKHFSLLL